MDKNENYIKRGYLNNDFKLFHLRDNFVQDIEYHYHEFHKIIFFISGKVTYIIEGKSYYLEPGDILLINQHDIHKPIIEPSEDYERIVIWVNPSFINKNSNDKYDISDCFKIIDKKRFNLIRLAVNFQRNITNIINDLEVSLKSKEFASELLSSTLFIQLIIYINRLLLNDLVEFSDSSFHYDKRIEDIIIYINSNLDGELSLDYISNIFFVSKYHLMRKFKAETGYTIHNYVQKKRLLKAVDLIKKKVPITKVCIDCGFKDYSTFSRAFKKMFGVSPSRVNSLGISTNNMS